PRPTAGRSGRSASRIHSARSRRAGRVPAVCESRNSTVQKARSRFCLSLFQPRIEASGTQSTVRVEFVLHRPQHSDRRGGLAPRASTGDRASEYGHPTRRGGDVVYSFDVGVGDGHGRHAGTETDGGAGAVGAAAFGEYVDEPAGPYPEPDGGLPYQFGVTCPGRGGRVLVEHGATEFGRELSGSRPGAFHGPFEPDHELAVEPL